MDSSRNEEQFLLAGVLAFGLSFCAFGDGDDRDGKAGDAVGEDFHFCVGGGLILLDVVEELAVGVGWYE